MRWILLFATMAVGCHKSPVEDQHAEVLALFDTVETLRRDIESGAGDTVYSKHANDNLKAMGPVHDLQSRNKLNSQHLECVNLILDAEYEYVALHDLYEKTPSESTKRRLHDTAAELQRAKQILDHWDDGFKS